MKRFALTMLAAATATVPVTAAGPEARYQDYPVAAYHGPRHAPDFTGPGQQYREYRTSIRWGFANGHMFAGPYVLFGIGCGAGCRLVYLGDLRSGRIHDFPLGGEDYYMLSFDFRPDSRLVKVHWQDQATNRCISEDLVLTGTQFSRRKAGAAAGNCWELFPSSYN